MKASIPADAVQRFHWVPGQNFSARVILLKSDNALTIPNIALDSQGDTATVNVRSGGGTEKRTVRIGVRGPSRAQVLDGLKGGEEIVISNDAAKTGSVATAGAAPAAAKAPP
jgi:HlyD family secretion protein